MHTRLYSGGKPLTDMTTVVADDIRDDAPEPPPSKFKVPARDANQEPVIGVRGAVKRPAIDTTVKAQKQRPPFSRFFHAAPYAP